jgi:hypothetical protein
MNSNLLEHKPVEQLFLDLPIQHVLVNKAGMPVVEPWATLYVDAIRDNRFGDAICALYNIIGDVEDDIKENAKQTVLDVIKEDALIYRVTAPEEYAMALSLYAKTSSNDGRTDVLKIVCNLSESDIARTKAEIAALPENQPEGLWERVQAFCIVS